MQLQEAACADDHEGDTSDDADGGSDVPSSSTSNSTSDSSCDDVEEKDAAREASNEELIDLDPNTVDLMRTLVASRAGRLRQQPDRLGGEVSLLKEHSKIAKRKDGRQRNDEPQSASRGDSGEAQASSSGSGDGSSEPSSPTGSESEDSSSDDESLQEKLARSTGPSHPQARIDPKPGGVKPSELLRRELWFYFDQAQQGAAKRGVRSQTSILRAGWNKGRVSKLQRGKFPLEITYHGSNGAIKLNTLLDLELYWMGGKEAVASTWALIAPAEC
jgi:hypothetical protein